MNVSESTLISWSKGPSHTEAEKCTNAETAVRKAIKSNEKLSGLNISVFAQGSYRARTNVRQNSDVGICVRYNSTFFPYYPPGTTKETFGNVNGAMSFRNFKEMVQAALENYFGSNGVTRGNKAFDVHANTYRIDADVVPTLEYRHYTGHQYLNGKYEYLAGVAFKPDKGNLIINWPHQTYRNSVAWNKDTKRKYKRTIRILKRLRDRMQDNKIAASKSVPSFLIECLVWNSHAGAFTNNTYTVILRYVIANTLNRTREDENCASWREVNKIKYLFRGSQPWSRQKANEFLQAAWDYVGYT